jgi:hypothetical protein
MEEFGEGISRQSSDRNRKIKCCDRFATGKNLTLLKSWFSGVVK